jgi:ketol-acid reductoisomerase
VEAEWTEQTYFDRGVLMMAFIKAGVELAFDTMVSAGIIEDSAYYESLHELPLIANTVARKKLYEMNRIISDTAEYGCYLFDHAAKPLLADFMATQVNPQDVGLEGYGHGVDNTTLITVNESIADHPIEFVGKKLRLAMTAMKTLNKE